IGIGLGAVFIVYQASRRLGLLTLYEMLDTLLTSLVLIIVVIFQNDIRRALMRFGKRAFFTSVRAAQQGHDIEEVVKSASMLAQKRIGALMVFERDADLGEFIEHGTVLDAAVSKEMLYSVFVPSFENPLHDGAVIIREGRVWQAGAVLPLTARPKLDRSLGTRHRAAVGLTEETDAVVVVVSEERGSMSLCFNGNMVRDLDAASLRKALRGLFYQETKKKKKPAKEEQSAGVRASAKANEAPSARPAEEKAGEVP
ncbi:MAG: diadenylate cyclase CdaA, partial [Proteobacteria bacterium]|nr:diadenylate cyclase CdaA [Pseudomonadota bacterium]